MLKMEYKIMVLDPDRMIHRTLQRQEIHEMKIEATVKE